MASFKNHRNHITKGDTMEVHSNFNLWSRIIEIRDRNKKLFNLGLTLMIVVTVINGIMLSVGDPRATVDSLILQLVGTGVLLAIILLAANYRPR